MIFLDAWISCVPRNVVSEGHMDLFCMERLMGRFWGSNSMLTARTGLAIAIVAASAALTVPAFADTSAAASTTPHKAKTSSKSPSSSTSKSTSSTSKKSAKSAQTLAPGECGPTPDQASIGMRALQTDLMVAGLKCSADQWNTFTAKFKAVIKQDADRLQKVFNKTYGKSGPNEMNSFVTQLANDASQRSNAFTEADYCKQQDVLYNKVLALTAAELEKFSAKRKVAVVQPVKLCEPDAEPPVTTTAAAGAPTTTTPGATAPATTAAAAGGAATPVVASTSASSKAGATAR
jgi:hypothetical protein